MTKLTLLCGLVVTAPLAAQMPAPRVHAVELTFTGGFFKPTGTAGQAGTLALTRRPSWEAGVHFAGYSKNGRFGAEVSTGFAPERVRQGTGQGSRRTNMKFGTARVLVGKSIRRPGVAYMVGGGLSLIHRPKGVVSSDESTTNVGGAASLVIRVPVDEQTGIRLDVQDLIYNADFGLGKKIRNDFVVGLGLGITW